MEDPNVIADQQVQMTDPFSSAGHDDVDLGSLFSSQTPEFADPNLVMDYTDPAAAQAQPQTPATAQESSNDEKRYQYWQSQADRAAREKQELEKFVRTIGQDPDISNLIQTKYGQKQAQPQPQSAPQKIAPPTAPAKPAAYNEVEALTNPESESFKYRAALERYRDERTEYLEKQLIAQAEERRQESEAQAQRLESQRQMTAMQRQLAAEFKLAPEQQNDFIQWASAPESMKLENLVRFWQFSKQAAAPQQNSAVQRRSERSIIPLPITGGASGVRQEVSENDAFLSSVKSWIKKPTAYQT